jgi:hypothetical protein
MITTFAIPESLGSRTYNSACFYLTFLRPHSLQKLSNSPSVSSFPDRASLPIPVSSFSGPGLVADSRSSFPGPGLVADSRRRLLVRFLLLEDLSSAERNTTLNQREC